MAISNSNPVETCAPVAPNNAGAPRCVAQHERRGMNLGALACRTAASLLVLSAGIAIGFDLLQQKAVSATSRTDSPALTSMTVFETAQTARTADPIAVSESDPQPIA